MAHHREAPRQRIPMQEKLSRFPHFRADNMKAIRAWSGKRMRVSRREAARETGLDYRVNLVRWRHATLAWVGFDVAMKITVPAYTTGYLVQLPDTDEQHFVIGRERVSATPSRAVVHSPNRAGPITQVSQPGGRLALQLDNALVRASLRECTGLEPNENLPDLPLTLDLTAGPGRFFRTLLMDLVQELDLPGSTLLSQDRVLDHLTRCLAALLVAPVADAFEKPVSAIDSVLAHIAGHLEQPMTVEELAGIGGVNKRSLQRAFQARFEMSPLEFVRRRRLEQAHSMLASGGAGITVTAAALRCGFSHMGRFARDYHAQYGEKPSETLARSRAPGRRDGT
jgi:AraC-like DNA-binding protein